MDKPVNTIPGATDCSANEPFALRVLGDSMEPEFPDGTIIIIDPAGAIENGCYVLARINRTDIEKNQPDDKKTGEGYIFRQFIINKNRYYLKPLNAGYATIEVSGHDSISGVVVQKAGTRRRNVKHYN